MSVTRKVMVGQINGMGGREVEVTYDIPIFATFAPLRDLTAYELAQAHAVIGESRAFIEEEWKSLQSAQRHWKLCNRELSPGYIQHHSNEEGQRMNTPDTLRLTRDLFLIALTVVAVKNLAIIVIENLIKRWRGNRA